VGGKIVDKQMFAGVLSHPVRCRALTILADREASPVEIARELGLEPSHVAYHVRLLHEEGLIELTKELPRRGSIEHRFRAVFYELSDEEYAALTPEERASFSRVIFSFAAADASCALSAGSFAERADHHISRFPLQVDEEGWDEVRDLYEDMLKQLYRIKRDAGDRLTESGVSGTSVLAFSTFFELPLDRVTPRTFDWVPPS
jgi:DNA-binding transcriptional ArsR family regulator